MTDTALDMTLEARKTQLTTRRKELLARLEHIEQDLDVQHSQDWEEAAVEREDDEMLEALGESGLTELKAIAAALTRIENGTYGDCAKCGEVIDPHRLDLVPHAPFCAKCAS